MRQYVRADYSLCKKCPHFKEYSSELTCGLTERAVAIGYKNQQYITYNPHFFIPDNCIYSLESMMKEQGSDFWATFKEANKRR